MNLKSSNILATVRAPVTPRYPLSNLSPSKCEAQLRISPLAMAKISYFLGNASGIEVSGFGVSGDPNDPLAVTDFVLIKQTAGLASVELSPEAVAEHLEESVANGLRPDQVMRIWIHTHPGMSVVPSSTDETTFGKAFGSCDWAIMCIFSENSASARLSSTIPVRHTVELPVVLDSSYGYSPVDYSALKEEFAEKVTEAPTHYYQYFHKSKATQASSHYSSDPWEITDRDEIEQEYALYGDLLQEL